MRAAHELLPSSSRATCRQLTSYLPAAHELLPSNSRATSQQLTSYLPAAHLPRADELLPSSSRATCRQLTSYFRAAHELLAGSSQATCRRSRATCRQLTSYLPAAHELLPSSRATCRQLTSYFPAAHELLARPPSEQLTRPPSEQLTERASEQLPGLDPWQASIPGRLVIRSWCVWQTNRNFRTVHRKFRDFTPKISATMASSRSSSGARRRASKQLRSTTAHFQIARQSSAHRRTASEAARAQFASTLEPLRLRTLRPPALKIDRPSKYRFLAYVSKLASQLLQSGELEHPPQRERKVLFHPFHVVLLRALISSPVLVSKSFIFPRFPCWLFGPPQHPPGNPGNHGNGGSDLPVAVFCRPSVRLSVGTSGRGSGAMIPLAGELRAENSGGRSSEWRWCLTVQGSIGGSSVTASHR